jgi:uncharacterized protein (TIGR00251 family)
MEATDISALRMTVLEGSVRFEVHAKPRASTSRVGGVREGALVVALAAPPVDGAANDELVATLARALGVAKRDVSIVRGDASRTKLVTVRGLSPAEVLARFSK